MFLLEVLSRSVLPSRLGYPYLTSGSEGGPCLWLGERQMSYHIARQGMPLQLSLLITVEEGNIPLPLKPRFGLSFPSCCDLLRSSENSAISILSMATTVFLVSTIPTKIKRKPKYYLLQKSSGNTALVRYKRPALSLRKAAPISK